MFPPRQAILIPVALTIARIPQRRTVGVIAIAGLYTCYQSPVAFARLLPIQFRVTDETQTMKSKLTEYVKVAEAAEILGVSQGTVRTWSEAGKIPMHRNPANGYRLFKRRELEQFLEAVDKPVIPSTKKRPK